jgi:hypothetical protein
MIACLDRHLMSRGSHCTDRHRDASEVSTSDLALTACPHPSLPPISGTFSKRMHFFHELRLTPSFRLCLSGYTWFQGVLSLQQQSEVRDVFECFKGKCVKPPCLTDPSGCDLYAFTPYFCSLLPFTERWD